MKAKGWVVIHISSILRNFDKRGKSDSIKKAIYNVKYTLSQKNLKAALLLCVFNEIESFLNIKNTVTARATQYCTKNNISSERFASLKFSALGFSPVSPYTKWSLSLEKNWSVQIELSKLSKYNNNFKPLSCSAPGDDKAANIETAVSTHRQFICSCDVTTVSNSLITSSSESFDMT